MVKTIFFCRRRPEITHERYAELLLHGHVPIALRHHPLMRRYVVNVVDEVFAGAPPIDSVGALWFESVDDFHERLYDSAEGETIVANDVARFMGGADAYATTEHVQRRRAESVRFGEPTRGVKLVVGVRRTPSLSHERFVAHWLERHVPLVLEDPRLRGYVTNVVDGALRGNPPSLDGVAELQFDSVEDLRAHMALAAAPPFREDLPRFVGAAFAYRAIEYVER
ncbi:MAG: EthD family reductase [Candidatus Binatia bacterium]